MIVLFDKKKRIDLDPANFNENIYNYYDRSGRADIKVIRSVLNKWFKNYPKKEKAELKSRFKDRFSSAFYELFIHELFIRQGFKILIHPKVPNSNNRPDFLLIKNDLIFYLEVKEAKGKTTKEEAEENKLNQFFDSINSIKSPNFFLNIEDIELKTQYQPSTKNFIHFIESELIKYNPDQVLNEIQNIGYDHIPKLHYDDGKFKITVSLFPKNKSLRNIIDVKSIGIMPGKSFIGGSEDSIKTSVTKKSKKYGKLNKPYIICINSIGDKFTGLYDVNNAIWGTLAL